MTTFESGPEMQPITYWAEICKYAGRIVAVSNTGYQDGSALEGRRFALVDETYSIYANGEEGYTLHMLFQIDKDSFGYNSVTDARLETQRYSMRMATREEVQLIANEIIASRRAFGYMTDKQEMFEILDRHLQKL